MLALKQDELAASIGVPLRTYSRYETGERPPKIDTLQGLGRLGIDLHWLITGKGQMVHAENVASVPSNIPLDLPMLSEIIRIVEEWLDRHNRSLGPVKKAEVVATLYEIAVDDREKTGDAIVDPKRADMILRLVA